MNQVKLIYGVDVLDGLRQLEPESVHCVVTSPPYWGLRSYGVEGQLGLEKTPEEYVSKIVGVFREVKRVLRKDGTLWLNLGDTYNAMTGNGFPGTGQTKLDKKSRNAKMIINKSKGRSTDRWGGGQVSVKELRPKNLIGIPWRVAFALQADGWYLRSDIIWAKPNPMPESVTDRPTKSHEYIFLLTKSAKYFYDSEAIKEPHTTDEGRPDGVVRDRIYNYDSKQKALGRSKNQSGGHSSLELSGRSDFYPQGGRNKRSVWEIATQPYAEAHFATFPEEIPRICISAGSKPGDLVLDPFSGSGTTGEVAVKLGRRYIGIDLNKKYEQLAIDRIGLFALTNDQS